MITAAAVTRAEIDADDPTVAADVVAFGALAEPGRGDRFHPAERPITGGMRKAHVS